MNFAGRPAFYVVYVLGFGVFIYLYLTAPHDFRPHEYDLGPSVPEMYQHAKRLLGLG